MSTEDVLPRLNDPVAKMNRVYRWMRYVCDRARRSCLRGRDHMLKEIAKQSAGRVLEVGCGKARNLRVLDERASQHTLYGLDASLAMVATARDTLERAGCTERVTLAQGSVQEFDPEKQVGVNDSFDIIFFSYVLSMMPSWPDALDAALGHLAPGGCLYILDVWNQDTLSSLVASTLQNWLGLFDVESRPTLVNILCRLDANGSFSCTITPVARRSAYLATVKRQTEDARSETPDPASLQSVAETEIQRFHSEEVIRG